MKRISIEEIVKCNMFLGFEFLRPTDRKYKDIYYASARLMVTGYPNFYCKNPINYKDLNTKGNEIIFIKKYFDQLYERETAIIKTDAPINSRYSCRLCGHPFGNINMMPSFNHVIWICDSCLSQLGDELEQRTKEFVHKYILENSHKYMLIKYSNTLNNDLCRLIFNIF